MKRIVAICLAASALAACETEGMGPPGPPPPPPSTGSGYIPPPSTNGFHESDFAWSRGTGGGAINGVVTFGGPGKYSCGDVVLAPETPWSSQRTMTMYGSTTEADVAVDDVRNRTPRDAADQAQAAAYARYARHAQCNASNHFSFAGLPNGAWYIVTVATPRAGGPKIAVMQRVATYGFAFKANLR
ncbi:MAG TPA: hypothetical protein VHW60_09545 [Caulobacteraceae bacterium]|jgi:hypothetical protein|nr:hypothetical protein [Caulobacteraceae bacterium]